MHATAIIDFVENKARLLITRDKQFIVLTPCFVVSVQTISSFCISFITCRSSDSSFDIPLFDSSCRVSDSLLPGGPFLLEILSKAAKVMTSTT